MRAILAADRLVSRGYFLLKGVIDGCGLALLDQEGIVELDQRYYDQQGKYLAASYNEQGLSLWERDVVDRFFDGRRRVAVTGAGGGREVIALRELGYHAVGFECNRAMVEFGNELLARRGKGAWLRHCERDVWPADGERYDAVIVGWGSYTHIRGRERRLSFLRGARRALPDGAPLLISFLDRPGGGLYFRVVAATGSVIRGVKRGEPVELGDGLTRYFAHYFTRREIADELAAAGFELALYETGDYARAVGIATDAPT